MAITRLKTKIITNKNKNMNINEEIQKATDNFIAEKLPQLIQEKVGKMLDDILSDTFKSWSNIGKQIKDKIEENLDVNLQEYDLIDYNALISKSINDRLVGIINENSIQPINELVNETVGFLKKKNFKLSEIHELVINSSMQEYEEETESEISFFAERNDKHKWITVSIDTDKDVSQEDCSLTFLINESSGRIFSFKTKSYWSKKSNLTPSKVTQMSNLEHKIFRLYSAQAKIEIDTLDFDNYWSRYN